MKFLIIILLGTFIGSCSDHRSVGESHGDDVSAIRAMSKARAEAFNKGDAAAIAQHFTEDGILMAPGTTVSLGKARVEEYYGKIFSTYQTLLESHYEEVEVSGYLAFGRGEAKVRLIDKINGDTTLSSSKYLNILKKQTDGSWKTTHDIWNDN